MINPAITGITTGSKFTENLVKHFVNKLLALYLPARIRRGSIFLKK